jgi:hypothetical protein
VLALKPRAVANQVNAILRQSLGSERFPLKVAEVAMELSKHWNPAAPITQVEGHAGVTGFEGALQCSPDQTRWRILYGRDRELPRQRFTIAHEFGHFALHRTLQTSFECTSDDLTGHSERDIELEADQFASALLMPLDDLRTQMRGQAFCFDLIKHCANRYGVSLTAAARQCAEVCEQRVVMAVACDGALVKAWSSTSAFRSGLYLPTRKLVIEVPERSIAHITRCNGEHGIEQLAASAWFPKEAHTQLTEHTLVSTANDSTLILLVLPKAGARFEDPEESDDERLESTSSRFERMAQHTNV